MSYKREPVVPDPRDIIDGNAGEGQVQFTW